MTLHRHFHHFDRGHDHHFGGRGRHGGFFGGRQFWDSEEGRGRRGRMFDSSELRLVLLKLVADQPRHGYDLIGAIEQLTDGAYSPSPGVVYPTLTLLADMGHIQETVSDGSRKTYAVTDAGSAHLAEHAETVEALFAKLKALAAASTRVDGAPIRRAMINLRTALMQRIERDGTEARTVHAITAILDEAAQKIERL